MVMEGDLTLGGEQTIEYADDVLWNCTLETYAILLIHVTPINSIKIKEKRILGFHVFQYFKDFVPLSTSLHIF